MLRPVFIGILSMALMSGPANARPAADSTGYYFSELELVLKAFVSSDSATDKLATEVQARLPAYYQLAAQAKSSSARQTRLDIICQRHSTPGMDGDRELLMWHSQWRVRQLLDSLRYDVIGAENISLNRITWDGLQAQAFREASERLEPGESLDTLRCQLMLIRSMNRVSGLAYLAHHPRAVMIGTEDWPLHRLQLSIIKHLNSSSPDRFENKLMVAVGQARSELAVIRTINALQHYPGRRGVIIIGFGHQEEMASIPRWYGLESVIFQTDPTGILNKKMWK